MKSVQSVSADVLRYSMDGMEGEEMEDSLILGKLTLLLLRASLPQPESLPADYRIVILPSQDLLGRDEALTQLARFSGIQVVSARIVKGNLEVTVRGPTPAEEARIARAGGGMAKSIRKLTANSDSNALVKVIGYWESVLAPASVVEEWVATIYCPGSYQGLWARSADDERDVMAVLRVGEFLEETTRSSH
jgi:hypothetical protein